MDKEEEIASLEARIADLRKQPAAEPINSGPKRGWKDWQIALAAAVVILPVMYLFNRPSRETRYEASAASRQAEPAATPGTCNRAWATQTAEAMRVSPMVRDMAMRPDGFHLVVRPRLWGSLSLDERDRAVSAFDCTIAGPGYLKAIFVEDATGETLKAYSAVDLYHARKLQPQ